MTIDPDADPRTEPLPRSDERATLSDFLNWHRQTLDLKCAGLSPEQLARRAVEPSAISLLGLVRHMADVEHYWFRELLAGQDVPPRFHSAADPDGDFEGAQGAAGAVEEAWRAWREAVDFSDAFVESAPDLDVTGNDRRRGTISLRWVMVHMIEEYARHNGHADFLRERIDGATGE